MHPKLITQYFPYIYFDKVEPFFPHRVGYTVMEAPGPSPSFRRGITFDPQKNILPLRNYSYRGRFWTMRFRKG